MGSLQSVPMQHAVCLRLALQTYIALLFLSHIKSSVLLASCRSKLLAWLPSEQLPRVCPFTLLSSSFCVACPTCRDDKHHTPCGQR